MRLQNPMSVLTQVDKKFIPSQRLSVNREMALFQLHLNARFVFTACCRSATVFITWNVATNGPIGCI